MPKPSRNAWYRDPDSHQYRRLTAAARAEITDGQQTDDDPTAARTGQ